MTKTPGYDWTGHRSDKWREHVDGLEAMLAAVDAPLLDALQLANARRIADVGCGGGATTLAVARRAAPGTAVVGVDVSPALINIARQRIGERDDIELVVGDAEQLRRDGAHDRIVSRFGTMAPCSSPDPRWRSPICTGG